MADFVLVVQSDNTFQSGINIWSNSKVVRRKVQYNPTRQ